MSTIAAFPVNATDGPRPNRWQEDEPEFLTDSATYQDGGQDYLLQNATPIRRWTLEFSNITEDEAALLDDHYEAAFGKTIGFTFLDIATGTTYADVHYEKYDRSNGEKRHIKNRAIRLVRRPRAASVDFVGLYSLPVAIPDCVMWLAADRLALTDGDRVGLWPDISGQGHNATQSGVTENKPVYTANAMNGLPALTFGNVGGGRFLRLPNFLTGFTSAEIFWVLKNDEDPPSSTSTLHALGTPDEGCIFRTTGEISDTFGANAITHNSGLPVEDLTQPFLYNAMSKAGQWRNRVNGASQYLVNTNSVGWSTSPVIGTNGNGLSNLGVFRGQIAEVVLFSRELTVRERSNLHRYFRDKYAINVLTL